jgi:hypothetical protein
MPMTVEAGEEVGHGDAHALRFALGRPGDRHEARHALDQVVVSGAVGIGPVLPETGDGTVDEARVERREGRVVEPVLRQAADLEILKENIGLRGEAADEVLSSAS